MLACSLTGGTYGVWVAGCPNVQKLSTQGATPRFLANVVVPFAQPLSAANYREALPGMAQGEGAVWVIGDAADRAALAHRSAATPDRRDDRASASRPEASPPAAARSGSRTSSATGS